MIATRTEEARPLYTLFLELFLNTYSLPGTPVLSMREAVFIVSPNTLNLGSLVPMRPVTTGPVCMPTRTRVGLPSWGMGTVLEQRRRACEVDTERGDEVRVNQKAFLGCKSSVQRTSHPPCPPWQRP